MSNLPFPIDETLTPQNANEHGYQWVADVAYDETEQVPPELYKDFQGLIIDGYKLGCAFYSFSNVDKGLYEPLELSKKYKISYQNPHSAVSRRQK